MLSRLFTFLKEWKLPVAMIIGVIMYFIIEALPLDATTTDSLYYGTSHWLQPCLIFSMLFLAFLRVGLHELRPHRWHGMLLLCQGLMMTACALVAAAPWLSPTAKILMEGAMLCFICPTATAAAVIVQKLGGSLSGCASYLILCNLLVSVLAPPLLTMVEPQVAVSHISSSLVPSSLGGGMLGVVFMIMGKVFPLLLCPLFAALLVRHYAPGLTRRLLRSRDLAFYMWLVALALAITVTVRTIVDSNINIYVLLGLACVSLACCAVQFAWGRRIGSRYGLHPEDCLTAGQAMGQKNTVFIIWLGLMFLNPVTSVVGGVYSVWHNAVNSWQLYRHDKEQGL
ncbi:MAG: transporter [Bacteroidales bacterium]|nr:transporter [Candidatus Sodaliphilus aphodohippi]